MIREVRATDLEEVVAVWAAASAVAHSFLDPDFLARERDMVRDVYMPRAETWVCEVDGRVAGFVSMLGNEVGGLFVDPSMQRRGIGRALVDHARALHGELEVEVFERNTHGRAFYAAYGFEPLLEKLHAPTGEQVLRLHLPIGAPGRR